MIKENNRIIETSWLTFLKVLCMRTERFTKSTELLMTFVVTAEEQGLHEDFWIYLWIPGYRLTQLLTDLLCSFVIKIMNFRCITEKVHDNFVTLPTTAERKVLCRYEG